MSSTVSTNTKGTALVTGAAQGIGRAIALQLAADGFDVGINDIPSKITLLEAVKAEVTGTGRRAAIFAADISVDADVRKMVADCVETFGGLDVMVANAAICKARGSLLDIDVAEWDHTFEINVRGTFLCYQHAARQMMAQGRGGRIIGACSGAGKQGYGMLPDYSASKFAVRGLTQAAAQEFGKHGITVNAYAPGSVVTAMTEQFPLLAGMNQEAFFEAQAQLAATKRNCTPEDIARMVSFLAAKESGFITGQSISVDGGRYFD
ncbi:L-2,3-butanediol dehydrogenase [Mycena sanguinolenta]|uniref:L-2,3-butanediol dehydrogenase n=1 Tax=Mycena sanguinolenta TaxID=230812 RepID=A0A8H6XJE2_9AGAR|nr:L-2,3-butanediol dehydrogenase [Mycena sanguinolenta]